VDQLYHRFRRQDPDVCRRYLISRGIDEQLVEELIADGEVLHNHYRNRSYCCFAVRNVSGDLQCLDNHEIAVLENSSWEPKCLQPGLGDTAPCIGGLHH
jgi:hypothetical protein